ncbi:hypothetical protein, partial [Duncaniella muris]|uniref:hypothetical protein n=1 Tax=Duncaniella muris TaxID=2094150 RepID=UPI0026759FAC
KACIRQKRIASSNLAHSANKTLKINNLDIGFSRFILRLLVNFRLSYHCKIGVFWGILGNFGAKCFSNVSAAETLLKHLQILKTLFNLTNHTLTPCLLLNSMLTQTETTC